MNKIIKKISGVNSVKGATAILIVTLFLSNLLGLVRDHYLAQKIPASILDAYYAAFRIPDLVFNVLILGAIIASFIPVFTKYIVKKELSEGWKVANSFLNIALVLISVSLIILFFVMPYIIPLLVPNLSQDLQELTLKLSRILLLSPLFFTVSYIFSSILNSFKRFLVYSLAPIVYNVAIITSTILFADTYGIVSVVWGVIAGAFLHMFIQYLETRRTGFKYAWVFDWRNKDVKKIFRLMVPRAIGLGANQIMLFVYTAIASTLTAGSIAAFNLADNIQTMPTVVFGISFATAIFPTLSEHINIGRYDHFSYHIHKSIRSIAYILIPLTAVFILLRAQIVRIILGSGYFGWNETIMTYDTLGLFAISLFAQGMIPLFARAYYAMEDTKTPTIVSIISVIIGIICAYIFTPLLDVSGLALAFSVASFANAIVLYWILRNKIKEIRNSERELCIFILKVILATGISAVLLQIGKIFMANYVDMERFFGIVLQTSVALLLAVIGYWVMSKLLKSTEQEAIIAMLKKYLSADVKTKQ